MIESTKEDAEKEARQYELQNYYRFHSGIYDLTRWSFLFGRDELLNMLPDLPTRPRIMEIGCGTGKNIKTLQYLFPDAEITGVDVSEDMLRKAGQKIDYAAAHVSLVSECYGKEEHRDRGSFDLILLAYTLTMTGDLLESILQDINNDLTPQGYIAVADFHTTRFEWFRKWMSMNHVDLGGHLLALLKKYFHPEECSVKKAYGGLWSYFLFLGESN